MLLLVNIALLLSGAVQAAFLSFILLKRKTFKSGYTFLAVYLVLLTFQIILKVMSKIWLIDNLEPLYMASYQFPLLYGPLVYLFAQQFLFQKKLRWVDTLHFLPPMIVVAYLILGDKNSQPPLILTPLFSLIPRLVLEIASILIYHFLAWQEWNKYQLQLKGYFSTIKKLQLKWLKKFIIVSAIVCSFISIVIFLMYLWYPFNQNVRFGFITLTIFIYWISYCAWNQPQIFSVIPGYANETKDPGIVADLKVYKAPKKYSNSGLNEEEKRRVLSKLECAMEQRKLFLDAEITIDKLAEEVGCSKHHLSQVLNGELHQSFYDYINGFRIKEAKLLLSDAELANHKIASIAYDAGFNSLSTFNEIFKKSVQLTPSQYRKQSKEQSQKQRV